MFTQGAIVSILQEGQATGVVEGEEPLTLLTSSFGFSGSAGYEVGGQTSQILFLLNEEFEGVVLVQNMVAEGDTQRGKLLVDFT